MMDIRELVHNQILTADIELLTYVHPTAYIAPYVEIGIGSVVLPYAHIGQNVKIGAGNFLYSNSHIEHDTIVGDFNWFSAQSLTLGFCNIGNKCFIGGNATIKNHIKLADKTLIGAGAYCSFDTNEGDVVVPQKSIILDKRSTEIYIK
jgi:UDP-3-O-[3-hydroxymyristoyl] glucosamine N-acyltransferase